eukprot:c18110_g1_i1.p1 GENE.c18110_g1_i1~~c18110_g1_i1.p1  ORF type:complete len:295 (-),score=91.46 c18110_g1_i1:190-1074(-)
MSNNTLDPTVKQWDDALKQMIQSTGGMSLDRLQSLMKDLDSNKSGRLEPEEFYDALVKFGLHISRKEAALYFRYLSKQYGKAECFVEMEPFLLSLVPKMNKLRRKLTKRAFAILDLNSNGTVSVDELKSCSCIRMIPQVADGTLSEVDETKKMLEFFKDKNEMELAAFSAYIEKRVSVFIENDDDFGKVMAEVWNVPYISEFMCTKCIKMIRDRMYHNADGNKDKAVKTCKKTFKNLDTDGSGELCLDEFESALKGMSVWLSPPMVKGLFEHFDHDSSNTISYEEFLQEIFDQK